MKMNDKEYRKKIDDLEKQVELHKFRCKARDALLSEIATNKRAGKWASRMARSLEACGECDCTWAPVYSPEPEVAAIELLDGAYDIIEIWRAEWPSQKAWKASWLSKARELGANPSF